MNKKISIFFLATFLLVLCFNNIYSDTKKSPFCSAMKLAREGEYKLAIEKTKDIANKNNDILEEDTAKFLGILYYKSKQYEKALDEFRKVNNINKDSIMPYYFMAMIYELNALKKKDVEKAKELKNESLKMWKQFLVLASAKDKKDVKKKHRHMHMSIDEKLESAKRHITVLEGELKDE